MLPESVHLLLGQLAGLWGAFVSMHFLKGRWYQRLWMAISGAIVSYYSTPFVSDKLGIPEVLARFFLGLFGMAIISKIWDSIEIAPLHTLWDAVVAFLKKIFRIS